MDSLYEKEYAGSFSDTLVYIMPDIFEADKKTQADET